jgi:hypothetical protein
MIIPKIDVNAIAGKVFGPNALAEFVKLDPKIKPSWSGGVFKIATVYRSMNMPMTLTMVQSLGDGSVAIPEVSQKHLFDKAVAHLKGDGATAHITVDIKQMLAEALMKGVGNKVQSQPELEKALKQMENVGKVQVTMPSVDTVDVLKATQASKVKLAMATMQYSAVFGTSPESTYFAIGAVEVGPDQFVKVAARYKGESVSVRVEGNVPGSVATDLGKLAIVKKKDYYSGHFDVKDDSMANRVMAGVIANIGGKQLWPIPNAKLIKNKGA